MVKRLGFLLAAVMLLLLIGLLPDAAHAQATRGTNWVGQFYNSASFAGNVVGTATYPNGLNFIWTGAPLQADGITPVPGVTVVDGFSAVFTTSYNFPAAGVYTFFGTADDQLAVIIGGQTIFSRINPPSGTPPVGAFSFQYSAPAPGLVTIQVQFQEFGGSAVLDLQWQLGAAGVPGLTPTPSGPMGTVVVVRGLSLRTGPYLGGSYITALRPGINYAVTAKNSTEGGPYTWYRVISGDRVGWASGRYLTVTLPEQIPEVGTIFQELTNPPDTGVIAVPRAIMNFRLFPSERARLLAQIPWGAEVPLLNRTIQGGRNHWFQVRYNGMVGWIYAPYVGWRGNIDAVPIR